MKVKIGSKIVRYDKEDHLLLSKYHWYIGAKGYVYGYIAPRKSSTKQVRMHRLILGLKPRMGVVDHINGVVTDNRRQNLRVATAQINAINKRNTPNGRYRGVYWDSGRNSYQISVRHNGKNYSGGRYKDRDEAALAAEELRKKVFGVNYPPNPHLADGKTIEEALAAISE